MKILALDLSSVRSGFCVIVNGKLQKKTCGVINADKKAGLGERLRNFESEIRKLIQLYKPDLIVVEDIFKGKNMNTFKILAMHRGVAIKVIFEESGKDPISIMAIVARKTMNLPKDKEEVFSIIKDKFKLKSYTFNKHNDIIDSVVLGLAAWEQYGKSI